jgi:hypothetical protein
MTTRVQGPVFVQGDVILEGDNTAVVIGDKRLTRADIDKLATVDARLSAVEAKVRDIPDAGT